MAQRQHSTIPALATSLVLALLLAGSAAARELSLGPTALIGAMESHVVEAEETLLDIARAYDLGYVELRAANPEMDPWLPPVGEAAIVPSAHLLPDAPRRGIVINLSALRLFYFPGGGKTVQTYPIGIGSAGAETPVGRTSVISKRPHPTWIPPASIRAEKPDLPAIVPPGPDNPLGDYAISLAQTGIEIHGTNIPWAIGRRVSHGCIRLYPEDIARLYPQVQPGTPVTFVDQPILLARIGGEIYMEAHATQAQTDQLEAEDKMTLVLEDGLMERIAKLAGPDAVRIDWWLVLQQEVERPGIPVRITKPAGEGL